MRNPFMYTKVGNEENPTLCKAWLTAPAKVLVGKILPVLLSVALAFSMTPGLSLNAYGSEEPRNSEGLGGGYSIHLKSSILNIMPIPR